MRHLRRVRQRVLPPAPHVEGEDPVTDYDIDGEPLPVAATPGAPTARCCNRLPWDCKCPQWCENCGKTYHGQGRCGDCYGGAA
jgi:hypothetical protein